MIKLFDEGSLTEDSLYSAIDKIKALKEDKTKKLFIKPSEMGFYYGRICRQQDMKGYTNE